MQFKIPYKREAGGESQRKKIDDGNRHKSWRFEDATLLALRMEEGARRPSNASSL